MRVSEQPVERTVAVAGTLAAYDQATLRVKVPGFLKEISVDLGSSVHEGQEVAKLDLQDYQLRLMQSEAALAQARARLGLSPEGQDDRIDPEKTGTVRQAQALLDEAKTRRDRSESLLEQGLLAKSDFSGVDASYKVALSRYQDALEEIRNRQAVLAQRRSELALARQQLVDTTIRAPFNGVVQEKQASIGEYLASGAPVVTVVRINPLRLRAEVPERSARDVRLQQPVRVAVEGDSRIYTGRIERLSPAISAESRMLLVEAEVSNHHGLLRAGQFTHVEIVTDTHALAKTLPLKALRTFAGIEKVLLVQNQRAFEKTVTTGRRIQDMAEILDGVKTGDLVVLEPGNLQTGEAVTVTE